MKPTVILTAALRDTLKRFALALTMGAAMYFGASPASAAPPVTAGLKMHLDASQLTGLSDGATVTTWSDVSGLANHATSSAGTPIYKTGVLNGKPVIRFNNASGFTTANLSSQFPTAATVLIVATINSDNAYTLVKANPGVDEWWRWDGDGRFYPGVFRGNRLESYCAMPDTGSHLFAITSSASAWEMSINGTSQGVAGANYNSGGAPLVIGNGSSGGGLNGDIAEVLIYSRVLNATELNTVGAYLSAKYRLTTRYIPPATITSFGTNVVGSSAVLGLSVAGVATIRWTVPYTSGSTPVLLAALAPEFTLSSGTCTNQTSGVAPVNPDFSASPVTYTVADGATVNNNVVTVTVAPASAASAMLTCNFGALGLAVIDEAAGTAVLTVPPSQSVTSLAPTFTLSLNAIINPASGSTQNFTNPVVYRVIAENGTSFKDYTVSVQTFAAWAHSGSMFIITTPDGANSPAGATEANFPLLLRFNSNNFNFAQAQSNGRDIRFTTAAGATLPYQIEQWDAVNGQAAVWLKIPTITGNSRQEIKMYWGKPDAPSQSSGTNVFNAANGYASVHHLGDTLADTIGTTTPANNGTTASNGLIGRSRTFAVGQGIQCGTSISGLPTGSGPFSTAVWIRPSTSGTVVLGWGLEQAQGKVIVNLASPPRIRIDGYFGGADVGGTAAIPLSEWVYIVHTYQSTGTRLYVNGVLDASTGGGLMNMPASSRFDIGGFVPTHGFNFVGDMDEVRISRVVRSANWVKLEYENQKPLQTLVGGIVQSGSDFSVSPTSVTMNESTSTTLTAQAGGAQKVYWIYRKNGQETLLATDQLSYTYTAPRITGNDSATLRFKAVFAAGPQTIDVPLTVLDTVPDPVFTLVPSTTAWDGRQTMTVTANISNLAVMQAAGFGTLNYKWTVSGVAVTKQTSNGTLTLTRSQGSGPMTASLTINNGGTPVSQSVIINVQEPASDPWAQRTPAANEKPVNKQFFARDPGTGLGTIHYRGTQGGATDVYLKVYTTDTGADVLYATHRQTLAGGAYSFAAPIAAGKVTYKVTYGTTSGGNDSAPLATVTDLVCGDAFIIEGQSNALATDNSAPDDTTNNNKWVRTYGLSSRWGYGISKGNDLQLGLWGWYLANRLVASNNMPVCIFNGAIGGTRIDVHRPNPANHSLPLGAGYGENSYADLYNRVVGAKLTHGIRAVMWHQGEQDQGSEGPDGDYDYKFYQQYFVDISAAWKQDFPNLRNYYLFQIWPAACGDTSRNDQLREVQRTLPYLYSNMKIMSTHGIVPGSGCHYEPLGYQKFSDLIGPLVEQDVYGVRPAAKLTAPNLLRAYFATAAKNEIALVFDQNMTWNPGAPTMLFLANSAGATSGTVSSGSATGNTVKLQVSGATTAATITYLKGLLSWQQANLLYGTNRIAALTFADVAIAPPVSGHLTNTAATGITTTSAVLRAALSAPAGAFSVHAFWNTVNAGTNASLWTNSAFVGAWTNVAATNLSYTATGLTPGTPYHFTFRATNAAGVVWATNVLTFTTLALPPSPVLPGGAVTMAGGVPTFNFPTVAGYKYRLVYKNALTDATWQPVIVPPDFPLPDGWSTTSTGTAMSITDSGVAGMGQRFYRLEAAYP